MRKLPQQPPGTLRQKGSFPSMVIFHTPFRLLPVMFIRINQCIVKIQATYRHNKTLSSFLIYYGISFHCQRKGASVFLLLALYAKTPCMVPHTGRKLLALPFPSPLSAGALTFCVHHGFANQIHRNHGRSQQNHRYPADYAKRHATEHIPNPSKYLYRNQSGVDNKSLH